MSRPAVGGEFVLIICAIPTLPTAVRRAFLTVRGQLVASDDF